MGLVDFLKTLGLDAYGKQFEEEGWESVDDLRAMNEDELGELCNKCGLKAGHKARLRKALGDTPSATPKLKDLESIHFKKTARNPTPQLPFRVVLIGNVGSGKTTIYNRLTNSCDLTASGRESVTMETVGKGDLTGMLYIIDTPGLGAQLQKMEHAKNLREALRFKDGVHAVVFVTELSDRTDTAARDINACLGILKPFKSNLFVLFNKVDMRAQGMPLATPLDSNGNYSECTGMATKAKYIEMIDRVHEAAGYIFYHKGVDREWLVKTLIAASAVCEPMRYDFSDFEFAWCFDVERDYTREELLKLEALVTDFSNLCTSISKQLQHIDSDPTIQGKKQVFLSDLGIKLNELAEKKVQQFSEVITDEVTPRIYADYLSTKKRIAAPLRSMLDKLQQLKGDELAIGLEHYRKCPHCGEVWYKKPARMGGMGCDGTTTCGSRMKELDIPEFGGLSFRFDLDEGTQTLKWSLNQEKPALSTHLKSRISDGRQEAKGCGKAITWSSMATITAQEVEQLNLQLSDLKDELEVVSMGSGKTRFSGYSNFQDGCSTFGKWISGSSGSGGYPSKACPTDNRLMLLEQSLTGLPNHWPSHLNV